MAEDGPKGIKINWPGSVFGMPKVVFSGVDEMPNFFSILLFCDRF